MIETTFALGYVPFSRAYPLFDPQYNLTQLTPPVAEPVTYDELSAHFRLDQDYDQALVVALGTAGREYVEKITRLSLMQATYQVQYDCFADMLGMKLPRRPVVSVSSVTYVDQTGTTQTLDPSLYLVDTKSVWTRIRPAPATTFPQTQVGGVNSVTVTFVAGTVATDPTLVSPMGKLAIWEWALAHYENREAVNTGKTGAVLPHSFDAIITLLSAPEVG